MVHLTVATPYPGTETWFTESRKLTTLDYRLFDIQHAVLPTKLPLQRFYEELVKTQDVINRKYLGWRGLRDASKIATRLLLHGQTNFIRMLWNFKNVYDPQRLYSDHFRDVKYTTGPRPEHKPRVAELYVHPPAIARADSAAHDHT